MMMDDSMKMKQWKKLKNILTNKVEKIWGGRRFVNKKMERMKIKKWMKLKTEWKQEETKLE